MTDRCINRMVLEDRVVYTPTKGEDMKAEQVLKDEFKMQMEECMDMMATAPDFPCCLITLLATRAVLNRMVKDTADAIKQACPDLMKEGGIQ